MSDVEITVRGSHRRFHPAERGTVHARIALEGADPKAVYDAVVRSAGRAHASITDLHDPSRGPVTWWSAQDVRTWTTRPWNKDGKQLPQVHHARTDLEVKFSDFARLSTWLREMSSVLGFAVDKVAWSLTEVRKAELVREARTGAVVNARDKAVAYAAALGLGDVRPLEVADSGMLGHDRRAEKPAAAPYARGAALAGSGEQDLTLLPEDIEITASVDARFVASGA
ncbi:SIMPL domain-containing protein [Georgenia sp. Z1344]|uniref:SIMPL domain-containing protein n=1 Tax=Georgenia sp. Z1344 TaxID=3416706 RepID=UPI003CEC80E6